MNSKFINLLFIIILSSIISSCHRNECDRISNMYLLSEDVLPIPFDSMASVESTLNYLQFKYCFENEKALPVIYYNLSKEKITESKKGAITFSLEPVPCFEQLEFDFDRILEINLDGNNLLIEDERLPLDSIPQYIYYQYLNYGKLKGFSQMPEGNGIWVITEKARPLSDLNPIIGKILKGYHESFELLSKGLTGKSICDLDSNEWKMVSNKMEFHLALKYSDEVEPIIKSE